MIRQKTSKRVADALAQIEGVDAVFMMKEGSVLRVQTVINTLEPAVMDKIYDTELKIIDENKLAKLDFSIVPRQGRDLTEIVQDPAFKVEYRRRRQRE